MNRSGCEHLVGKSGVPDGSSEENFQIEYCPIDHGDWISGFTLYTADPRLSCSNTVSHVQSLDVIFTSGKILPIRSNVERSNLCQRPLLVTPGRNLIGIAGQIVHNHIARLGIIEGCLPIPVSDEEETSRSSLQELPNLQKYLWHSTLEQEYGKKLWNVDRLNLLELQRSDSTYKSAFPESLASRHPLLFARNKDDLTCLIRISAFVPTVDYMTAETEEGPIDFLIDRIAGIKSEQSVNDRNKMRYVGYNKLEGSVITGKGDFSPITNDLEWDEDHVVDFDIDGPGGEIITDVAVSQNSNVIRALRVSLLISTTNTNPFVHFKKARKASYSM